ncbi:MAG: STAS domain-containing protein [Betaproteobacteria bacterium]|nr:STAS domain-containing protein [Betaproteobacteria bacterium]NBY08703.1 STAS domain-containing protein [Betaproteobacteria bacterium]
MTRLAQFRPKLLEALKGYSQLRFLKDLGAGATVGVVALPLAMAFAIASGLKPEAGVFTAIIAGFLISLLGGSRVQIGGPAGAFIVIVYGIVAQYGVAYLIIATALSGVVLFLMGLFKFGNLIRFMPVSVVIGFTNGIAVLIATSQIKDFLGLDVQRMPADFLGVIHAVIDHWHTVSLNTVYLSVFCLILLIVWQFVLPRVAIFKRITSIPGPILALVVATFLTLFLHLEIATIGSKFGGIPSEFPQWVWPSFSWQSAQQLFMPVITISLLGAIESLLCARIADGMIDDKHDPNQELMAQGIANFVTPFFGGMPATGTIARTVTNAKSGATSPVAGMAHALILLLIVWVAAPLAFDVPLCALSAILIFVAWNMGEWRAFVHLQQFRLPYRFTLLAVFVLTVMVDLTVAVGVGLTTACLTLIYRMGTLIRCDTVIKNTHTQAHRLHGALFFAAVQVIEQLEMDLPDQLLVVDLTHLIYLDSSGADALRNLLNSCHKKGMRCVLCGLNRQPLGMVDRAGLLQLGSKDDVLLHWEAGLALAQSPH